MNLPNKLTLLRACLVPVFLLFALLPCIPGNYFIALVVFTVASITDALDGKIARERGLVTNFGKFLDPLADKVLVISALAVFVDLDAMSCVPFVIIIAREFMVSGLRLLAADSGVVVAAGFSGKLKTAFTMVSIIFILLVFSLNDNFKWFGFDIPKIVNTVLDIAKIVLIWVSTALTVISGIDYLKAYGKLISSDK